MQVGLITGARQVELVERPAPRPEPGRAVVEITYCGICGTDLHAYLTGQPYNPAICGHEWVGSVAAVGGGVGNVREGDRVAIGVATACGQCDACRRGQTTHCQTAFAGAIGVGPMAAAHGGFARAIAFDATRLYQVPDSLTDVEAAILEPATVAVHALRRTSLHLGDRAIVIGGGPIGLLVLQAALLAGAGMVVLIEPEPARRELGLTLGASASLDPNAAGFNAALTDLIGANGADVVFECAGVPSTIQTSVDLVRRGGCVSLVGVAAHDATIRPGAWLAKEPRIVASIAYLHEDFEITKALVAQGRLHTAPLHTRTVPLNELANALERLAEHPNEVKILVDPRG